jgi:16S rRNA processing protein RimM
LSADEERWIRVGRVGRPHGVKGAFVVQEPSEAPERFAVGARVWVGREPAEVVESKRAGGGRLVVRLDREAARGDAIELPESELPEPEEGAYYAYRLVGLAVHEQGDGELGRVSEVEPGVANDVLRLDSGVALPLVEDCILEIDVEAGQIVVAPGFAVAG